MPVPASINRILREFRRYTGDGLPNEPAAAPLPVGDPSSGANSPKKSELREVLSDVVMAADDAAERAEQALDDAVAMIVPDNSVSTSKLVNSAVSTAKLADDAVTPAKISDAPTDIAALQSMLGITASTAIGRSINGLLLANHPSTPNTVLNIGVGSARDKDQSMDMVLATGWSKTTAAWAAGTGNGMLDSGTIAANKGYHVFLIFNPTSGLYDFRCSLSATAPTMPAGFTKRRRIGGFLTDASGFVRKGTWYASGDFRLQKAISVVEGIAGNNITLQALPVPLGAKLKVNGFLLGSSPSSSPTPHAAFWIILRDPDLGTIDNVADQWFDAAVYKFAGANDGGPFSSWTDTSGQVYFVAYPRNATNLIYVYLQGWTDLREEFA